MKGKLKNNYTLREPSVFAIELTVRNIPEIVSALIEAHKEFIVEMGKSKGLSISVVTKRWDGLSKEELVASDGEYIVVDVFGQVSVLNRDNFMAIYESIPQPQSQKT